MSASAASPPFPPHSPGHCAPGATSGSCSPVIGTWSSNSPTLKSLDNAPRWRRCRPPNSAARRPGTGCRFTCCYVLNCTTVRATPMAMKRDETGVITTFASGVLPPPPPNLRQAHWTGTGQRTSFTPTIGRRHSRPPTSPGEALTSPRSSPSITSPIRDSSRRNRCGELARRKIPSTSTGSNSTTRCPSSRAASSTPRTSPPSARPMPGRSRPANLAVAWKACSGSAPTPRS